MKTSTFEWRAMKTSTFTANRASRARHAFHAVGLLVAIGVVSAVVACSASDSTGSGLDGEDAGNTADTAPPQTTDVGDASLDAPDADATDDEDVVPPDASVVCSAEPCAVALTATGHSFCALLRDGHVSCWGNDDRGQLGYAVPMLPDYRMFSATARVVSDIADVTTLSAGDGNTCASSKNGGVFCWGAPNLVAAGQVPVEGTEVGYDPIFTPTRQDAVPPATSVAVGSGMACATLADGSLSCWGSNIHYELGRGVTENPYLPGAPGSPLLRSQAIASIIPAFQRAFAITPTGDVLSWGASTLYGSPPWGVGTQYGGSYIYLLARDTSEDPDGIPAFAPLLSHVRSLASGRTHGCAIMRRDVVCWGANDFGQLGRGTYDAFGYLPDTSNLRFVSDAAKTDAGLPSQAKDVPSKIAVGDGHSCVVMGSGSVYCWGINGGLLGTSVDDSKSGIPTRIQGLSDVAVNIATGDSSACALLRSGAIECWGANDLGQLGTGIADDKPHPTPVRALLPN